MFDNPFRPKLIVGALPVTLTNGTVADATQVMSDLQWIVNQVNSNAAPLANTALLNASNNFTQPQAGVAAVTVAQFPIASQVQNQSFNTLSSTLGTNAITARVAALPLAAYAAGQVFRFTPSQPNTGPASITIDSAGSSIIYSMGSATIGGELRAGVPVEVVSDGIKMDIIGPALRATLLSNSLGSDVVLNAAGYVDGPTLAQGTVGTWFVSGTVTFRELNTGSFVFVKLHDGANIIASAELALPAMNVISPVALSGFIDTPAGNLRISAKDSAVNDTRMIFNGSGNGKDSTLSATRIK